MLKFAILCRVSTDSQADEGQSLTVQENTLTKCVEFLQGVIVERFIGQEHSTEGSDRPILDEAIKGMRQKRFNALMVYDLSRLTRDPIQCKVILAELKKHNINLYVQTQYYSLDNPETNFVLGLMSEVNAFQVAIQLKKAVDSKLELARKGWIVYGQPPFGRKLAHNDRSKDPVWILDDEKIAIAHRIYDLYINQRQHVYKISKLLGLDDALLYRILKDKGIHRQTFKINGKQTVVETQIPKLFTPEQSDLINERLRSNRLSNGSKQIYVLRGVVKCEVCGLTYLGFTSTDGKYTYYNHSKHQFNTGCLRSVHRKPLEKVVLETIAELITNSKLLMDTVKQCNRNSIQRVEELQQSIAALLNNQDKAEKRKARIVKLVIDGVLEEAETSKELARIRNEINDTQIEIAAKQAELESLNNTEVPEAVIKRIQTVFHTLQGHYGKSVADWNEESKRFLIEWFFGNSKQCGVWISGKDNEVRYTIKSTIGTVAFGWLGDEDGPAGVLPDGGNQGNSSTLTQFAAIIEGLDFKSNTHELKSPKRSRCRRCRPVCWCRPPDAVASRCSAARA